MRTTVTLDEDVVKALEALRRERGLGTSAALNELVRRGLAATEPPRARFRQRTSSMGAPKVALDDIGSALELLEGEGHG
ncbi:ribbon-helix-helix protein, CopG family [Rhabdothermincola sp.]|uniref:ribbon-helix-helix protein, CopG family n=1 Tax=Rhabdothermincola sp. TaxID=2820405 RepID=UPI002FDF2E54